MKKELALHFLTTVILFLLISLVRGYLNISFWPFWLGALIGTLLPDLDHIIYVYYLRPHELTSQRIQYMTKKGELIASWHLLASTRNERQNLILHTLIFQIIFVVLSFLVFTSSASFHGRGLALAFLLHLFVDQLLDMKALGNINTWFKNFPLVFDNLQLNIYLLANFVFILLLSFLM